MAHIVSGRGKHSPPMRSYFINSLLWFVSNITIIRLYSTALNILPAEEHAHLGKIFIPVCI